MTKIPQTRGLINNRYLFLTGLEREKSKIKVPTDLVSGEGSASSFIDGHLRLFSCFYWVEVGGDLSEASCIRVLIPFMKALPSWPNHLPKTPPPDTIKLGIRFQHRNLGWGGGHKHSVTAVLFTRHLINISRPRIFIERNIRKPGLLKETWDLE